MAAPTIRGVGAVAAGIAAVTPAYPTGTAAGDLVVMFVESANPGVPATATGWTQLINIELGLTIASNTMLTVLSRTVSNPATDNRTTNDTGNHQVARIVGVEVGTWNTSNPFNVTNTGTSGNVLSIPGATTTVNDCLILAAQASVGPDADSTTEYSNAVNASLTSLAIQINNTTAEGNGGGLLVISGVKATAGTVSATTADAVSTSNRAYGFLAIEPAAGGTPHTATITDPQGLTDTVAAVAEAVRSQTDPQGLTDTVAAVSEAVRSQTDPLGLVDDVDDVLTPGGGGVAHDAATKADVDAGTVGSVVHTPVGTPRGVLGVYVRNVAADDIVTGMTYGGVAMTRVAFAADVAGEPGAAWIYFLGSSVPTGQQTLQVAASATGNQKHLCCITITADGDTEIAAFDVVEGDVANPQVALDSGAAIALRYVTIFSGLGVVTDLAVLASMTALVNRDFGAQVARTDRETTATAGSVTIGYTAATEDVAMVAVAVQEATGGTGHTKTATDPLGLTDFLAVLAAYLRTSTDPLGLVDDATRVADNVRTQTDPAGLTDDVTVSQDHVVAVTDTLGLLDAAAGTSTLERSQTDPAGLTDTAVPVTDSERTQTDPLGLVDSAVDELFGAGEVSITDPLGLADSGSAELVNDADPLGLTDSVEVVNGRSQTDPLGLVDSVETVGDTARSFTDPLGLSDTVEAVTDSTRSQTDPLGLTDDVTYDLTAGGVAHTATVTDTLGLTDSVATAATYDRTQTDPLGLVDSVATTGTSERSLTDPLGLTDSIVVDSTGAHARQADDVLGLTDDITVSHVIGAVDYTATITDVLGLLDSETFTATYDQTVTDPLGLLDDLATQLTGPGFWSLDPVGYTANSVSHTKAPVVYVPVGPDDTPPPW